MNIAFESEARKKTILCKMGGSSSKPEIDNKGVLNGNVINNGNIIEAIEKDISSETFLLKIIIALKVVHILLIVIKWFVKYIKNKENRERQIEQILVERNRS